MIFHENCLPADDPHEISRLICYFGKKQQNLKLSSVQISNSHELAHISSLLNICLGTKNCISFPDKS